MKNEPTGALEDILLPSLPRKRLRNAIAVACQSFGPWPAGPSRYKNRPNYSVDQIIAVLEAPRLPIHRPARLPFRTRENPSVPIWSATAGLVLVDDITMMDFTRKEIDAAIAGVRVAWLFRDFHALGLRADKMPKRGITELLHEKAHLDRIAAVVHQWLDALGTKALRALWLTASASFNERSGRSGFEAFRETTRQLGQALARSSALLETEIAWERNLDDDLKGSAQARFIRESIVPCFNEIYGVKGISRSNNVRSAQKPSKAILRGPIISFAIEVFKVVGSDVEPETIDDGKDRDRMKKGRARTGIKFAPMAANTWRLLFLSTGELSLADKLAEDGHKVTAGQEVRVVELAADAGAGHGLFENLHGAMDADAFARQLSECTQEHYGHAARRFLEQLSDDLDGAIREVRKNMNSFEERHLRANASGQVRRVLTRFALVAAAGEPLGSAFCLGYQTMRSAE